MALAYVLFSSLAIVGRLAEPALGELADVLCMSVIVWSYPLNPSPRPVPFPISNDFPLAAGTAVVRIGLTHEA